MRLELGSFPVHEINFGARTSWDDGVLEVNREELVEAILSDPRVLQAGLEIARPGDPVRITTVRDVIEPRIKVQGPGTVYPGIVGRPVTTVGQGRTHRLQGVGVVEVAAVPLYLNPGSGSWTDRTIIDMRGNGDLSPPQTRLLNLCVCLEVDGNLDIEDRNIAAHKAALVVSDRIAATTADLEPPELEVFELGPVEPSLPKVAYILCEHSPEHHAGSLHGWGEHLYGITRLHPPWVIHPNELLDGALCFGNSWAVVNDPLLLELYARHGVEIDFAGCIVIRTRWSSQMEKDVTSQQAAKAAQMLGAQGVVIVAFVGGNDFMEAVRAAQACELAGLETVFVVHEDEPSEGGSSILEPLPEVRAIVSTGVGRPDMSSAPVSGVERVIGDPELTLNLSTGVGKTTAYDELPWFRSGLSWGGIGSRTSCFEY